MLILLLFSFILGLSPGTLNAIQHRVGSLEVLLEKSEAELKGLLPITSKLEPSYDEEEARRLVRAMTSLRQCRKASGKKEDSFELFWDSWDSRQSNSSGHHHHHHHYHHHQQQHARATSGNAGASPRTARSHRQHHYHHHHYQQQLAKSSTSAANAAPTTAGATTTTATSDGNNSGVQSPIESSPPESYNNSQSSTSAAAVHSPAEESSTMSTNLTPSPPMSPLSLQQQPPQRQPPQPYSSSPMNNHNSLTNICGGRSGTPTTTTTTSRMTSSDCKGAGGCNNHNSAIDKVPSTPPPRVKHQTTMSSSSPLECGTPTVLSPQQSQWTTTTASSAQGNVPNAICGQQQPQQTVIMTKSKSHELQLITNELQQSGTGASATCTTPNNGTSNKTATAHNGSGMKAPRSRLHTEPGPDSTNDLFNEKPASNSLSVPRSPLTPTTTGTGNNNAQNIQASGGNQMAATLNHDIPHHFTRNFKLTTATCNFCNRQMFYGLKCKECKYRCHKECEPHVPPSCGLPQQVFDMINSSPNMNRTHGGGATTLGSGGHHISRRTTQDLINSKGGGVSTLIMGSGEGRTGGVGGGGPDSSSAGSSCNSSSPSSPALLLGTSSSGHNNYFGSHFQQHHHSHQPQTPQGAGFFGGGHHPKHQFMFPEVATALNEETTLYKNADMVNSSISVLSDNRPPNSPRITLTADREDSGGDGLAGDVDEGQYYNGFGMDGGDSVQSPLLLLSGNGDEGNNRGPTATSHEMTQEEKTGSTMSGSSTNTGGSSTESERTPVRLDSTEERDSMAWPRQNSLSLKEWDIPYDDLRLLEQLGEGRFGTVHRALWHGDVAVKLLKGLDDDRTLEAFKLEVAIFKKTRHENVVLFMGACMKPPRLAIVTSLCKGKTLYTHIYVCRDKFNLNKATMVAQQISQGMGYLHARGIVHKDLKTKNIFLENGKVIITDFGLFSATKLQYCERGVEVQENWLCYLAPELIRGLMPMRSQGEDLCFSRASDVYAFGTVWYELLCGEFPYRKVSAESVIWQVGRGMKPTLANLQASRDVKDILMLCWAFQGDDRKDFATLLGLLDRLPKKRLARSPSHPVQLSKSAESVF